MLGHVCLGLGVLALGTMLLSWVFFFPLWSVGCKSIQFLVHSFIGREESGTAITWWCHLAAGTRNTGQAQPYFSPTAKHSVRTVAQFTQPEGLTPEAPRPPPIGACAMPVGQRGTGHAPSGAMYEDLFDVCRLTS